MNICIGGRHPLLAAIKAALEHYGHTVSAATDMREGVEALILLPAGDLEQATRGTYELLRAAASVGARQVVLVSSLAFVGRLPNNWKLTTMWRPRPSPALPEVRCYLAELSAREMTRTRGLRTHCLRLGGDVSDAAAAAAAIAALGRPTDSKPLPDWTLEHLGNADGRPDADFRAWEAALDGARGERAPNSALCPNGPLSCYLARYGGRFRNDKLRQILGWEAKDGLELLWQDGWQA